MKEAFTRYKHYLVRVKPFPLRIGSKWTTHFEIYYDSRDAIEPIQSVHRGNECASEQEAFNVGLGEAKRIVDEL